MGHNREGERAGGQAFGFSAGFESFMARSGRKQRPSRDSRDPQTTTMADSNSIPVMRKPTDAMSAGLNSSNLAASAMQRHPIDRMQRGELGGCVCATPYMPLALIRPDALTLHDMILCNSKRCQWVNALAPRS